MDSVPPPPPPTENSRCLRLKYWSTVQCTVYINKHPIKHIPNTFFSAMCMTPGKQTLPWHALAHTGNPLHLQYCTVSKTLLYPTYSITVSGCCRVWLRSLQDNAESNKPCFRHYGEIVCDFPVFKNHLHTVLKYCPIVSYRLFFLETQDFW